MGDLTGGGGRLMTSAPDIVTLIYDMVQEHISVLTILEPYPGTGYESWITNSIPPFYFNVDLSTPASRTFDITICMPSGTGPGTYDFKLYMMGDSAVFAEQWVTVHHCLDPIPSSNAWCRIILVLIISCMIMTASRHIH